MCVISLMILFSTIANSNTGVLVGTGSVVLASYLLGLLPKISKYLRRSPQYNWKTAKDGIAVKLNRLLLQCFLKSPPRSGVFFPENQVISQNRHQIWQVGCFLPGLCVSCLHRYFAALAQSLPFFRQALVFLNPYFQPLSGLYRRGRREKLKKFHNTEFNSEI